MANESLLRPMIDGETALTGIMGWPVAHSRSPLIHNHWFQTYGINGAYVPLPVATGNFADAVKGLAAAGFRGLNVTVPHKQTALQIADRVEDSAARIGAANVLSFEDGLIVAGNSDAIGFANALAESAPDFQASGKTAVVLGAGGAARAVIAALLETNLAQIVIVNRSADRAKALAAHFDGNFEIRNWSSLPGCLKSADLLVNSTTLGMVGQPPLDMSLSALPQSAVVMDLVYKPLQTALLLAAKERGLIAIDGHGMLLHQAAAAFQRWFGVLPAIDAPLRDLISQ